MVKAPARWQQFIRDSILEPMLARDLLSLRTVSKPALLRQTLALVLRYPAQEISLQKLLGATSRQRQFNNNTRVP